MLNGMPYLAAALESIERQSFTDYQVALWDNGSTDGTVELARQWIPARLPGVIVTDRHLPLGHSLAAMVEEFQTEFCARMDADDTTHPHRLQIQVDYLKAHQEIALVGSQMRLLTGAGEEQEWSTPFPLYHDQIVQELLRSNPVGHPSVLFRRAAVLAAGNYRDFSPTHVEDYELWLRMAAKGFRLANLDADLVNYRVHANSTTQKSMAANRLDAEMIKRVAEIAPDLYGCSSVAMEQLRLKKSRFAAPALCRIARHLGDEKLVWRSPIFYRAARQMIADTDLVSRAIAAYKTNGLKGVAIESKTAMMDFVRLIQRAVIRK